LISELHEIFGEKRQACISREISKIHEEHLRGSLAELKIGLEEKKLKGEIVVILEGKKTEKKIKQNKYKNS
jgi:16S rRNA (cytidine1402-2'-O)-methyltransferase